MDVSPLPKLCLFCRLKRFGIGCTGLVHLSAILVPLPLTQLAFGTKMAASWTKPIEVTWEGSFLLLAPGTVRKDVRRFRSNIAWREGRESWMRAAAAAAVTVTIGDDRGRNKHRHREQGVWVSLAVECYSSSPLCSALFRSDPKQSEASVEN